MRRESSPCAGPEVGVAVIGNDSLPVRQLADADVVPDDGGEPPLLVADGSRRYLAGSLGRRHLRPLRRVDPSGDLCSGARQPTRVELLDGALGSGFLVARELPVTEHPVELRELAGRELAGWKLLLNLR